MSRSAIYTVNNTTQAVAVNGTIGLGTVNRRFGSNLSLVGNAIRECGTGYYKYCANFSVAPTAAGDVTVTAYKDGVAIPGAIAMKQFSNPANPQSHYETTGPEIFKQLEGHIDYLVAGAGSGGTFSGAVKYLKEQNPNIMGVLADPVGSIIGGGEHADYDIEGIGNDFIADTMDVSLVDKVIKITDENAFSTSRLLAEKEGILAGSSSGAALYATLRLAEEIDEGNIVAILPDRGDRYLSKGLF